MKFICWPYLLIASFLCLPSFAITSSNNTDSVKTSTTTISTVKSSISTPTAIQQTTQILLINSLNQDMPWQKSVEEGLRVELNDRAMKFDLYVENMDVGRFDESMQKAFMKTLLINKYRNKTIDIVITQDVSAAALMSELLMDKNAVFGKIPKIYLEPQKDFTAHADESALVVHTELDFEQATFDAVKLANPAKIITISDSNNEISNDFSERLTPIITNQLPHLELEEWVDLSVEQLIARVSSQSDNALILYTPLFKQQNNIPLTPFQLAELLSRESNTPIFTYWHSLLGSGVVGGYLLSGERLGVQAAKAIIDFITTGSLKPINVEAMSAHYYDWRQLEKFNIAQSRLPYDSVIAYYQPSYFEQNKTLILSSVAIILVLLGFLGFVTALNKKRLNLVEALNIERNTLEHRVKDRTKALKEERDRAESLAAAKSEFLANMSHEIRTPMNGVIGIANMLKETNLDHTQHQYIDKIRYSSDQLLVVINDILDFSKIESGTISLEEIPFSINSVVDYIHSSFEFLAKEKGIEFNVNVDQNVHPDLMGDIVRINQVLLNLCSNAVKFTTKGGVTVDITSKPFYENPSEETQVLSVQFSVTDTGIGIEEKNLPHLFDAFTQEDSSTTRKFGGTGLGLTISKRLCELMDGDITVESTPTVGSCFIATMHIKLNGQVVISDENDARFEDPLDVLIIDDNMLALKALDEQLSHMNVRTTVCDSAQAALDLIEQKNLTFHAIILDWTMPVVDGEMFLTRLQQVNPGASDVNIVLTAYNTDIVNRFSEQLNIKTVLQKPVLTSLLFNTLNHALFCQDDTVGDGLADKNLALSNMNILVAEDNEINQMIISAMLNSEGANVEIVENGKKATEQCVAGQFDVILMDIHMPVMDGVEATKTIRSMDNTAKSNIPIIALTANVMEDDIKQYLAVGMNAHVAKPTNLEVLKETIKQVMTS